VLAQDFNDWEMIVVDDGSTDETGTIVQAYSDKRIHYHYTKNQGAPSARNFGCSLASGTYFTFLDSDDEYLDGHLSLRSAMISAEPAIQLIHGAVEVIGDQMVADCNDPTKLIPISECTAGATFFIRRDLFSRLEGFAKIPYADDNDFYLRAVDQGALIRKVDKPTYRYYRTEADSLCAIVRQDGIAALEKIKSNA
jgi:glycosyltransferase involved in cell wall biosynthesis